MVLLVWIARHFFVDKVSQQTDHKNDHGKYKQHDCGIGEVQVVNIPGQRENGHEQNREKSGHKNPQGII